MLKINRAKAYVIGAHDISKSLLDLSHLLKKLSNWLFNLTVV